MAKQEQTVALKQVEEAVFEEVDGDITAVLKRVRAKYAQKARDLRVEALEQQKVEIEQSAQQYDEVVGTLDMLIEGRRDYGTDPSVQA
jgi:hypothetical protein